jgi:hypothetical protein
LTKHSGRARSLCDGSKHFSFEDRLQLCFNPEGESAPVFPLTHRGVRGLTTTTAFEAVVFERESEVMNRAS